MKRASVFPDATGSHEALLQAIRRAARPFAMTDADYESIVELCGDARLVMIGEASHGTDEFYAIRAALTRILIENKGFTAVAVEADWPDAHRVNRWVRASSDERSADSALSGFQRFPTWMWRNTVVLEFVDWLRTHNLSLPAEGRVGFYGLDLYSLHTSIGQVLAYLDRVDPAAAQRARRRYACFDHFGEDTQACGYAALTGRAEPCEGDVVGQLVELRTNAASYLDGIRAREAFFDAEQNARLIKNAEQYYRAMFRGGVESWNLRDRHMFETLQALVDQLERTGRSAKVVVWAHNSHLGDARVTEMGAHGELNLGQLIRQKHGLSTFSIGFTTHSGIVTAASDWDAPAEQKRVRPALAGSYEATFHESGIPRFFLQLGGAEPPELQAARLERAIGVVYRPETERLSHYFHALLPFQFDAVVHIDETRAVVPLERTPHWESAEPPATYPIGI